jgi:hypothetical protein
MKKILFSLLLFAFFGQLSAQTNPVITAFTIAQEEFFRKASLVNQVFQ